MSQTVKDNVLSLYETFTHAIDESLSIELSDREVVMVDNFIDKLVKEHGDSSIGVTYLYNYFAFQFDYWIGKETRANSRRFPMGWIVGGKAMQRWKDRRERDLYHCLKTASRLGVKVGQFKKKRAFDYSKTQPHEENDKAAYFNTEQGFGFCVETTTLYNHKSAFCSKCVFADSCKEILAEMYPRILIQRGYATNTTQARNKGSISNKRTKSKVRGLNK